MRFESREVPPLNNFNLRDMIDDDDLFDDLVEITFDDVSHISATPPYSDEEDDGMEEDVQEDDSILKFTHHTGAVFCCDLHPSGKVAVTGGEDEKAMIWLVLNGKIIKEVDSFEDSVSEVAFSFDGKYLAAADMTGNLHVFQVDINSDSLNGVSVSHVWSEKVEEIQWMQWHKQAHVLMAGGAESVSYLWKIPSGDCKTLVGDPDCTAGCFMPDGKRALLAYGNGCVKVINLVNCEVLCQFKSELSLGGIISSACHPNNNFAAVGDSGGKVAFFSTQSPAKVLRVISFSDEREFTPENVNPCIENLIFTQSCLIVTTGSTIFVWDYTKQAVRHNMTLDAGITKVIPIGESFLGVASGRGPLFLISPWPLISLLHTFYGHADTVLAISWSGDKILSSSDDSSAKVFGIPEILNGQSESSHNQSEMSSS